MSAPSQPDEYQRLMQQIDEEVNILVLVSGTLEDGSAHYAYVSIPPSKYVAFKQAEAAGHYNLADYGTILHHGAGKQPGADVQQQMEAEYGVNHRFEAEIEALQQQMRQALQGKAE